MARFGDLLLIEVSERIKASVREVDTVARFGGDEFVVLLESSSSDREDATHNAGVVAEKIREVLSCPYQLQGTTNIAVRPVSESPVSWYDEHMDMLIKHADAAMYQAKEEGGNTVRFYATELQE